MPEQHQERLRRFREEDEARWKREDQELERQSRILSGLKRSDEEVREQLKKAGFNLRALERESGIEADELRRAHEELLKIPPSRKGSRPDRILLDRISASHGEF
ncbi:hypothetical protein GCM10010420_15050 [Streptomyces glaucosporus]|uniref:Uncharacterized protein n=1 Tax=Streptomyces glaucosporus TaxID=284044 RepID=A0ABN3I069_9ACTN